MSENNREQWVQDLGVHAREVEKMSRSLADLARQPRAEKQVVLLTAQIMRHRISMALLSAQLHEPLTVS